MRFGPRITVVEARIAQKNRVAAVAPGAFKASLCNRVFGVFVAWEPWGEKSGKRKVLREKTSRTGLASRATDRNVTTTVQALGTKGAL